MKKTTIWMVMLLTTVLILSACSPKAVEPETEQTPVEPQGIIAEGRLLPANDLAHAFSIPGKVAEVLVQDGDVVTRGQILARLSVSPDAAAALARGQQEELAAQQALDALRKNAELNLAQAQLTFLGAKEKVEDTEADFEASETEENKARLDEARAAMMLAESKLMALENGQGVDPDQLAAAQARLNSAKAAVASAQGFIDAHTLTAEIDGTAAGLNMQAGEQTAAGLPVLTIADFTNWVVKTENLTEMEIVDVEVGQKVDVILDALPEITLSGEVSAINSRFEEKRGDITYTVTVRLDQVDSQMRWGMTAAVRFVQ